jgi:hypothetical protein
MKVREVIKRLEEDGCRLARTKAAIANSIIRASQERLPSQGIHQWTFLPER